MPKQKGYGMYRHLILVLLLCSCSKIPLASPSYDIDVREAWRYIGLNERADRSQLAAFLGVDPVRTEWCAAFVNSVLRDQGIRGTQDHPHPLTARSFLTWGEESPLPEPGNVIVFPRGNQGWQGHVGFYVKSEFINGIEYYVILGGNQDNSVTLERYAAHRALAIRRLPKDESQIL